MHGLAHPFSLAFLPNGDALSRSAARRCGSCTASRAAKGAATLEPEPIAGAPEPGPFRGAGIAEVALHPKFATNHSSTSRTTSPAPSDPNVEAAGRAARRAVALGRGKLEG